MAVPTKDDLTTSFNPEELILCPYDPAHTIMRERMTIHLQRCRRQHLKEAREFQDCMYNINHKVPRLEYQYHLETCAERQAAISAKYQIGQVDNNIVPMLDQNTRKQIEISCEENWDEDDSHVVVGNILETVEATANEKAVLKNRSHLTKSERRQIREVDRREFRQKLNEEERKSVVSQPSIYSSSTTSYSQGYPSAMSSRYSESEEDDVESVISNLTINSRVTTGTDISYQTAEKKAVDKMRKMDERKDRVVGLGRSRALPAQLQLGIGRGRRRD